MVDAQTPTTEGVRRYPPDGYYGYEQIDRAPCTCTQECNEPCKGACGCEACSNSYSDFLDTDID